MLGKVGFFFVSLLVVPVLLAEPQPTLASSAAPTTPGVQSGPAFDVKAAVDAYLATVPQDKKAKSDAYFEGGYWLQLWDFLIGAVIAIFLMQTRLSARMRDWSVRMSSWRGVQDLVYFVEFVV